MISQDIHERLPVVVITPIKNESWILKRFLETTSYFADCIIIADQFSEDNSVEIAKQFPKVHLIKNENLDYDEAYRQKLLISEARKLFKGPMLLLSLDADEVMTAESLNSVEWKTIFSQAPGTVICFEKPDLIFPVTKCIRHKSYFKLGYIDDGTNHEGLKIHSNRVPEKHNSKHLMVETIKFMHYALTREREYWARQRYYAIVENIEGTSSLITRLKRYSPMLQQKNLNIEETPCEWFEGWKLKNVDCYSVITTDNNYFNQKALALIAKSPRKFWLDDIWYKENLFDNPPIITKYMRKFLIQLINKVQK